MSALRRAAYATGLPAAAYFAWTTVRLTRGTTATVRALTSARDAGAAPACRFVVLLPMLREDRLVAAACEQFARAAEAGVALEVVVVTSEREREERDAALQRLAAVADGAQSDGWRGPAALALAGGGAEAFGAALAGGDRPTARALLAERARPTTAEVARDAIAALNARLGRPVFRLMDGDAAVATKVDKLNAALATLDGDDGPPTYVAVFDADSAPDFGAFGAVASVVAEREAAGSPPPAIFQQVSCYCRDLPAIRGARAPFVIADALAQTRWALGFEYPLYRRYAERARGGGLRPLVYCIGHGCFVSLAFLREIGGFPTFSPTDDLALGYLASALGAEVAPVPALDYCEVAPRPLASVRQARFWFTGSARFARDLRLLRPRLPAPPGRLQWAYLHLDGHARNAAWAGRGAGWLVPTALALGARAWGLVVVLTALHAAYVQAGLIQTLRALRALPGAAERTGVDRLGRRDVTLAATAASATFLLRSAGPLSGAVGMLMGRTAAANKIER